MIEDRERIAKELYGDHVTYDSLTEWGRFAVDQEINAEPVATPGVPQTRSIDNFTGITARVNELENIVKRLQEENYDYVLEIEELKTEIERQRPQP